MKTRVTGIFIEDNKILLLDQDVENSRTWSLPGGTVEEGETLEKALIREMHEETGLEIKVDRLLYVCDHILNDRHVLHITFQVSKVGGVLGRVTAGKDTNKIRGVEFAPIEELTTKGFSDKFQQIVIQGFPEAGSYMGPKSAIGL